ncbi:hypothetical protein B0H10DRAFT_1944746 [Mycena sp. CBHHK59/15]|nr:hypothetical protein B0H10DRAFT_1944746 [Mycena sp. CBHHK59/15]
MADPGAPPPFAQHPETRYEAPAPPQLTQPPQFQGQCRGLLGPRHLYSCSASSIPVSRPCCTCPESAGSCQKGKGKKHQYSSDEAEDSDAPVNKHGRLQGSVNFSKADTKKLLNLTEKELPLGQKGWEVIKKGYSKWARANDRPQRPGKSVKNKYKQLGV